MIRSLVMFKQSQRELQRQIHPTAVLPIKLGGLPVANQVVFAVQVFVMLYISTIIVLPLILVASGLDFISAFSAIIACINNAGPGLNQVGPATNYSVLTDFQTWVCTFTMLLGRLELMTMFVLFTRTFWRA